jgi:hypothetical protein
MLSEQLPNMPTKRPAAGDADTSLRPVPPLPGSGLAHAEAASDGAISPAPSAGDAHQRSLPGAAPAAAPAVPLAPVSPGRNRQLFLASVTPQLMTCDLRSAVVGMGIRHNLEAIIIAIFPTQKGPPARKHIFIMDSFGVTGVTVWNSDVHKFPKDVLGGVISITRASVSSFQGKKSLVLSKESVVTVSTEGKGPMAEWWESLALQTPLPLASALIAADNSIINVFGVVAFISSEQKDINGQLRTVTSVHLASQTARFQLRGWDLDAGTLNRLDSLRDQVIQVRRCRVTCFAENKIGEILDSPLGTALLPYRDDALERFWAE